MKHPTRMPNRAVRRCLALVSVLAISSAALASDVLSVDTLAGNPIQSGHADGDPATASFFYPSAVAVDTDGTIYVADAANHVIRMLVPDGTVTTLAGSPGEPGLRDGEGPAARFRYPNAIAVDRQGNLVVADTENCAIRRITRGGFTTTIAGGSDGCGWLDGPAQQAQFGHPAGLGIDGDGTIFVADTSAHAIRKIGTDGMVSTYAGTPGARGIVDKRGFDARFAYPRGLAIDSAGNLLVADSGNNVIRRITRDRAVSTICGTAGSAGLVDGPCAAARFDEPAGVALASDGTFYVLDTLNETVRRVDLEDTVSTVAGFPREAGFSDGTAYSALFNHPLGIALAPGHDLIIADMLNHAIRRARLIEKASRERPVRR